MTTRVVLGIDPDLWNIGVAIVTKEGVENVSIISQYGKPRGDKAVIGMASFVMDSLADFIISTDVIPDKVVIEGQMIYLRAKAGPDRIIRLAQVAGMCVLSAEFALPEATIVMPSPQMWKGSIPKHIKHKRILDSVGWGYTGDKTIIPEVPEELQGTIDIAKHNWTHAIDAIGLAKWGLG